tara:strand:+ start:162 stop:917 length:756 start_codon:yes stop_codon:yes gene_type:complete
MKNKTTSIKRLGNINSIGGDRSNFDTFNIYSKSSLFKYDYAKDLNKQCSIVSENFDKGFKYRKHKDIFPNNFTQIKLKKNNFFPHYWYMDDIGNSIGIYLMKYPEIGEGIVYTPSFAMFDSPGSWFKKSFLKYFLKIQKTNEYINIDDNKLCFGFFDDWDLDFRKIKEFFKKKNKENIKKFKNYMEEKYNNIVKNRTGNNNFVKNKGSGIYECKVPNGKHYFYTFISKIDIPDSSIMKGDFMGNLILYKKK